MHDRGVTTSNPTSYTYNFEFEIDIFVKAISADEGVCDRFDHLCIYMHIRLRRYQSASSPVSLAIRSRRTRGRYIIKASSSIEFWALNPIYITVQSINDEYEYEIRIVS